MLYLLDMLGKFTTWQSQYIDTGAENGAATQNIPDEILQLVFSKATLRDQASLTRVCHRWHAVNSDDVLWKDLFYQIFITELQFDEFEMIMVNHKAECKKKIKALSYPPIVKINLDFYNKINKETEEGQRILISMATQLAKEDPLVLAQNIQKFGIKSEEARIELAKSIVNNTCYSKDKNAEILAQNIQNFGIKSEEARIELANIVVAHNNHALAYNIHRFGIKSEKANSELAYRVSTYTLANNIHKFNIQNEDVKIELAKRLLDKNYLQELVDNIQNLNIQDEDIRILLAKSVARKCPSYGLYEYSHYIDNKFENSLGSIVKNFNIQKQDAIIELARILAHHHPRVIAVYMQNFGIQSEDVRIMLAMIVLPTIDVDYSNSLAFAMNIQNIQNFGITNPQALFEIAELLVHNHEDKKIEVAESLVHDYEDKKKLSYRYSTENREETLSKILRNFVGNLKKHTPHQAYKLAVYIPCEKEKSKALDEVVKYLISNQSLFSAAKAANLIPNEQTKSLALQQVVNALALRQNYKEAFEACNNIPDGEIKFHLLMDITKAFFISNNNHEDIKSYLKFIALACQKREIVMILDILYESEFSIEVKTELALRFGSALSDGELSGIVLQIVNNKFKMPTKK